MTGIPGITSTPTPPGKLDPRTFLVRKLRGDAQHNNKVAYSYLVSATKEGDARLQGFLSLTFSQLCSIHNFTASLCNVGRVDKRVGEAKCREAIAIALSLMVEVAKAWKEGAAPFNSWVHSTYAPLPMPGEKRRASVSVRYKEALAAGLIAPVVAWPSDNDGAKALYGDVIEQRPVGGGFMLAPSSDAKAQREREAKQPKPKGSGSTPADILAELSE